MPLGCINYSSFWFIHNINNIRFLYLFNTKHIIFIPHFWPYWVIFVFKTVIYTVKSIIHIYFSLWGFTINYILLKFNIVSTCEFSELFIHCNGLEYIIVFCCYFLVIFLSKYFYREYKLPPLSILFWLHILSTQIFLWTVVESGDHNYLCWVWSNFCC